MRKRAVSAPRVPSATRVEVENVLRWVSAESLRAAEARGAGEREMRLRRAAHRLLETGAGERDAVCALLELAEREVTAERGTAGITADGPRCGLPDRTRPR